jgi:hypothetical protein
MGWGRERKDMVRTNKGNQLQGSSQFWGMTDFVCMRGWAAAASDCRGGSYPGLSKPTHL